MRRGGDYLTRIEMPPTVGEQLSLPVQRKDIERFFEERVSLFEVDAKRVELRLLVPRAEAQDDPPPESLSTAAAAPCNTLRNVLDNNVLPQC